MADSYLSPATFMTPLDWKAPSGLGGWLAGRNDQIMQHILSRQFEDDDLQKQILRMKMEGMTDELETNKVGNKLKRQDFEQDLGMGDLRQQSKESKLRGDVTDQQHKARMQELQEKIATGEELIALDDAMSQENGGMGVPMHMTEDVNRLAKTMGLKLTGDGMQDRRLITQAAQIARNRVPLKKEELERAMKLQIAQGHDNTSLQVAKLHNEGSKAVANINYDRAQSQFKQTTDNLLAELQQEYTTVGPDNMKLERLEVLRSMLVAKIDPETSKRVGVKINELVKQGASDSQARREAWKEVLESQFDRIENAIAKKGGTPPPNPSPSKPQEGVPEVTIKGKTYIKRQDGKWYPK